MEILIKKKNISLDSQLLSTLMSCARLTDFNFNMNLRSMDGKSIPFEMGSIVHKGFEVYYGHLRDKFPRKMAYEHALIAAKEYSMDPNEVRNTPPEDVQWALDTIEQYFDFYKTDSIIPIHVEYVKGDVIYEDDELRILWKAKYDLIADMDRGILPIDHKTMKMRRDTISLNNQFIGQCILQGTRTMIVNKVGFQKTLKPVEKFLRVPISYSADRLLEWQSQILPYYAKLLLMYTEQNYFPPNFTHCENKYGFCKFKGVCEVDRGLREEMLKVDFVAGEPWDINND